MKAPLRERRIRDLLATQEFLDMATLCQELGASESSVRRDLASLERAGLLRRVHGGALATEAGGGLLDFSQQSRRASDEKKRIGRLAASLVEDGETVILDGGSTVTAVARELLGRSLHVITNSLPIAQVFWDARTIEVTLTGGFLYPRLGVLLGPFCEEMLSGLAADVVVMGAGGVTETGLSNNNTLIVGAEKKMIAAARRVIIAVDHTKFGRPAMVPLTPLDAVDIVVSDVRLGEEYRRLLKRHKVEIQLA